MTVNRGRVRLLVAALKSGEYKKTAGRLHSTGTNRDGETEGWCCLGVASDVAHKFGVPLDREENTSTRCEMFNGAVDYMPPEVAAWYGFESSNPKLNVDGMQYLASTVNDTGYHKEGGAQYTQASLADIGNFFRDTYLKKQK